MPRKNKEAALSPRAKKVWARVLAGEFYMPYGRDCPKAMDELVAAGLVATTGRVTRVELCYVPSFGYKPFVQEKFQARGALVSRCRGSVEALD